jgi:hypothetical protein
MKDTGHVWGRHDLMFRMGEFDSVVETDGTGHLLTRK